MKRVSTILVLMLTLAAFGGELPKLPESPKDDKHWYTEQPDNKELNDTLLNGDFEQARTEAVPGPKNWGHPDGLTVIWEKDDDPKHGLVIKIDPDVLEDEAKARQVQMREAIEKNAAPPAAKKKTAVSSSQQYATVGATYGVSLYSEKIKCKPKQAYKISFDFKGPVYDGSIFMAKVFIRGFGTAKEQDGTERPRRLWETIVNCRAKEAGWRHFEQAFHPTRRPGSKVLKRDPGKTEEKKDDDYKYVDIAYLRVMLYAYWPRTQYYFDNIRIEEISNDEFERLKKIPADAR
jgi:hypothetical protein